MHPIRFTPQTHVVVIDHSSDIRLLFEDLLASEHYRVTALPGMVDPVADVCALRPDVIVHDFTPRTAADDLRAMECLLDDCRTAHIPLVLCSAALDIDDVAGLLGPRRVRVLRKPFSVDEVLQVIAQPRLTFHTPGPGHFVAG